MSSSSIQGTSGISGWQCSNCRAWVGFGQSHSCNPVTTQNWPLDSVGNLRIADALERIAAALEAQAEPEDKQAA